MRPYVIQKVGAGSRAFPPHVGWAPLTPRHVYLVLISA